MIIRADHPETLLRTSIATPSLAAGIMNGKAVLLSMMGAQKQLYINNATIKKHVDTKCVL